MACTDRVRAAMSFSWSCNTASVDRSRPVACSTATLTNTVADQNCSYGDRGGNIVVEVSPAHLSLIGSVMSGASVYSTSDSPAGRRRDLHNAAVELRQRHLRQPCGCRTTRT